MFNSISKTSPAVKSIITIGLTAGLAFAPVALAQDTPEHQHGDTAGDKTVTGEVVDMMCYLDHNAMGDKHAGCAAKCIRNNSPVGVVENGKAYLIVGDHKPINDQLADYAGKTITVKGKLAERGGIAMIENAEIVKK